MTDRCDVVAGLRSSKIWHNFKRVLTHGTGTFDREISACLRNQRLQAFEFAAPYRFHVAIPPRVTRFSLISDPHGPYLQDIRLRSAGKFDSVSGIGGLSEHDPAARDPRRRHALGNLVAEA